MAVGKVLQAESLNRALRAQSFEGAEPHENCVFLVPRAGLAALLELRGSPDASAR